MYNLVGDLPDNVITYCTGEPDARCHKVLIILVIIWIRLLRDSSEGGGGSDRGAKPQMPFFWYCFDWAKGFFTWKLRHCRNAFFEYFLKNFFFRWKIAIWTFWHRWPKMPQNEVFYKGNLKIPTVFPYVRAIFGGGSSDSGRQNFQIAISRRNFFFWKNPNFFICRNVWIIQKRRDIGNRSNTHKTAFGYVPDPPPQRSLSTTGFIYMKTVILKPAVTMTKRGSPLYKLYINL